MLYTSLPITFYCRLQQKIPLVHKFFRILPRRPKINQFNLGGWLGVLSRQVHSTNLSCLPIIQEIGPIRVRLHESELEELLHAQYKNVPGDL